MTPFHWFVLALVSLCFLVGLRISYRSVKRKERFSAHQRNASAKHQQDFRDHFPSDYFD